MGRAERESKIKNLEARLEYGDVMARNKMRQLEDDLSDSGVLVSEQSGGTTLRANSKR